MMKSICSLLMITLVSACAYAQALTSPVMLIFGNKDIVDGFPLAEVDSITFHTDADGRFVQNVWSHSESASLPLSEIEKIQFQESETKLNSKVFPFTAEHNAYILGFDETHIYLQAQTPATLVPGKGNIVAAAYDCTGLTYGFIGKVKSVTTDSTLPSSGEAAILIECEPASFDDIYDHIVYAGTLEEPSAADMQTSYAPSRVEGSLEKELWNKSFSKTFGNSNSKTTVNVGDRASIRFVICKTPELPLSASIRVLNQFTSNFSHNTDYEGSYAPEPVQLGPTFRLGRITFPHPLLRFIWMEPQFNISGYVELKGDAHLDINAHYNRTDDFTLTFSDDKWKVTHNGINDSNLDAASLLLHGSAEIGLIPEIILSLNGTPNGIGLSSKCGLNLDANFMIDATQADDGTYAMLKDSKLDLSVHSDVSAVCKAGLFSSSAQRYEYQIKDASFPIWAKYFLPEFELTKMYGHTAYFNVTRNLVTPVELASHMYDKSGKLVSTAYDGDIYSGNDDQHTFLWKHDIADSSKDYVLYPVVKIAGIELRATPAVLMKKCPAQITGYTQEAPYYDAKELKNNVPLYIDLELEPGADEVLEWGIATGPAPNGKLFQVDNPNEYLQSMLMQWSKTTSDAIDSGMLDLENCKLEVHTGAYAYAIVRNRETQQVDTLYTPNYPIYLLYDKKPLIRYSDASIGDTEITSHSDSADEYMTYFRYHKIIEGAIWMLDGEQMYTNGWFVYNGDPYIAEFRDDSGYYKSFNHYYEDTNLEFSQWIEYTLRSNGKRQRSNCLNFYGDGQYIVGVTVSDDPLYQGTADAPGSAEGLHNGRVGSVDFVKEMMESAVEKYKNVPIINN